MFTVGRSMFNFQYEKVSAWIRPGIGGAGMGQNFAALLCISARNPAIVAP
jgi:hypothetical protein